MQNRNPCDKLHFVHLAIGIVLPMVFCVVDFSYSLYALLLLFVVASVKHNVEKL